MSEHKLYSGSSPESYIEYILWDSGSVPQGFTAGSVQESASGSISNIAISFDPYYLQRNTLSSSFIVINSADSTFLQRFNMSSNKLPATIVWLMRARNTENNRYIYWRSPHKPSSFGISGIRADTVESVGSVYEEI
jgi:hypothetical protein